MADSYTCYRQEHEPYWGPLNATEYGNAAPCWQPTSDTDIVPCCGSGDICLEDGICQATTTTKEGTGAGYYTTACTDPNVRDSECNLACNDWYLPWIMYNTTSDMWQCCGTIDDTQYGGINCSDPTNTTFSAPAPAALGVLATATFYTTTTSSSSISSSSTSTTSSASSASPMTTVVSTVTAASTSSSATAAAAATSSAASSPAASSSSSLSTGAEAGIGVGAAAGALFLISLLLFFLRRRRRQSKDTPPSYAAANAHQPIVELGDSSKPAEMYHATHNVKSKNSEPTELA